MGSSTWLVKKPGCISNVIPAIYFLQGNFNANLWSLNFIIFLIYFFSHRSIAPCFFFISFSSTCPASKSATLKLLHNILAEIVCLSENFWPFMKGLEWRSSDRAAGRLIVILSGLFCLSSIQAFQSLASILRYDAIITSVYDLFTLADTWFPVPDFCIQMLSIYDRPGTVLRNISLRV